MQTAQYQLTIGALLHDIGKLLYRYNDGRSHAESGYDYLRNQVHISDPEILRQVRYHHAAALKGAKLPTDSLAYITYIADNIASAADRRKADEQGIGFVRDLAQDSIFNLLNGNDGHSKYAPGVLSGKINYPTEKPVRYDQAFYGKCVDQIGSCLQGIVFEKEYLNSLLEVLEAMLSFVPSSTSLQEVADVSLFDHSKLTAALAACIYEYLSEQGEADYRARLFQSAREFYSEKAFFLYSIDISGIQDFIYTITSDGALKALRARSFYLELIMEHLVDEVLDAVGVSRANCIYCGGGHAYLLFANTSDTRKTLKNFEQATNGWFLEHFGTALYLAGGGAECSANDLKNEPEGSYKALFAAVSRAISCQKRNRYSAEQILALNHAPMWEQLRECSVCHRTDMLSGDKCTICTGLENFSKAIQTKPFFAVSKTKENAILPLPGDQYLSAENEDGLHGKMKKDSGYVRCYCKNEFYTGHGLATRLWVGDYQNGDDFHTLVKSAEGIPRLAVLRADVDNLGQAFVSGFESEKYGQRYVTLSRTATFSRKLALFFKRHINTLLREGSYFLTDDDDPRRKATVVYAGGDDLFVIGAWDDIVGFAVDLYDALGAYSQNTLTISAGIGVYPEKYPVSTMARQTGALENAAKNHPGKNAVALFDERTVYSWPIFIENVLEEKYRLLAEFFGAMQDYGKAFLYRLLDLMRGRGEKINLARYAYLLARMEPPNDAPLQEKELYREFSQKMYQWMQDEAECQQAITAIMIYVYTIRDKQEGRA